MVNTNIRKRKPRIGFNNNEFIQYLQKDCVNIVHIPVGTMSASKASEYMAGFVANIKDLTEGYKVIYLAKKD